MFSVFIVTFILDCLIMSLIHTEAATNDVLEELSEFTQIENEINTTFSDLILTLKRRRDQLLSQVL